MDEIAPCRWRPGPADVLLLLLLLALALSLGLAPITNNDIWLHLATGDWILQQGQVPRHEVFSFVAEGRPYTAHEWGSQVLFAWLHRLAGLSALIATKVITALVLAYWMFASARRRGATPPRAALFSALALFIAGGHLWVRPHLLTWLALAATLRVLECSRQQRRWLLTLLPLQVVWTNIHGGFILGPAIVLAWGAGEAVAAAMGRRALKPACLPPLVTSLLMGGVTLINPYGLDLVLFPFELTGMPVFMQAVYEWQSPLSSAYMGTTMFAAFMLLTAGAIFAAISRGKHQDWGTLAVMLLLFLLALRMNRNVPLFALAAAPLVAATLPVGWLRHVRARTLEKFAAALLLVGLTGQIALAGYPYGAGDRRPLGWGLGPRVPVGACDTLAAVNATGHAFTTYGEGAYVAWRLWPKVQVSMDSRNSVYGSDLYLAYRSALENESGMKSYLQRWPVDLAVASHQGPFRRGFIPSQGRSADQPHQGLLAHGGLLLIDFDDDTAAYARPDRLSAADLEAFGYQVIHPVLQPSAFAPGQLQQAEEEALRAVARRPHSVVAHWILAQVLAQARKPEQALAALQQLAQLDTRRAARRWGVTSSFEASRFYLTALMQAQLGRCPAARASLQQALDRDPDHEPARRLLASLGC